jgi:3-methylfumaryl-CoA hydratase
MSDAYAEWIGRSVSRGDMASARLLAEYRATLGPWLFDDAQSDECPPGFHWCLAPATPQLADTGLDGAETKGLFLPPIPLSRRMWAGGSIETIRPLKAGQAVTRVSRLSAVTERQGSTGVFYLASIEHEISDQRGPILWERQDLVFRDGAPKSVIDPDRAPPAKELVWTVDPSPLLLFRFSAMTFNGHRIHYDAPYAAEEGYPGLVVHGPLQAALMLNLASIALGHAPRRFDYRCVAPLFSGHRFTVQRDKESFPPVVRIVRHDGVTTAKGQVHAQET